AYSLYDREVGYCQGSAFIAGLLLMHMPEEDAFFVLVSLMQDYKMREMYKPNMFYLGLCMYQLECMVEELLPELHRHFQAEGFHTSMYSSTWFLTLFTTQLPLALVCRIMDVFLSEGMEIIFRVGIALLEIHQDDLMMLAMEDMLKDRLQDTFKTVQGSMNAVTSYFQKDLPSKHETDHDFLFSKAFAVKYNAKKMKKLEKDYSTIRKEEQEEQIEIRRLRNENKLLKQRIENLEKV
ncbi:unnamed protein product, partial [Didymodactylos carnosus]